MLRMSEAIHPLRAFRERHSPPLNKAALARLLGCSCSAITRWEAGKRQPDERMIPLIAEKTGIAPQELRPDLAALMRAAE